MGIRFTSLIWTHEITNLVKTKRLLPVSGVSGGSSGEELLSLSVSCCSLFLPRVNGVEKSRGVLLLMMLGRVCTLYSLRNRYQRGLSHCHCHCLITFTTGVFRVLLALHNSRPEIIRLFTTRVLVNCLVTKLSSR